jgi:GAF domain-containing protein
MWAHYKDARHFSQSEKDAWRLYASHASLAIKKAEHIEQITKATETAQIVTRFANLGDVQQMMKSVVEGTYNTLACDSVTLYTYDEEKDKFEFPPAMIGVKNPKEVLELDYVDRDSAPYNIVRRDQLYVTEDSQNDPLIKGQFTKRENIEATVAIPLIARDIKVGVMFVNYSRPHFFTKEEIDWIKLFSGQAALALHNAQQFEHLNSHIQHQLAVYQASKVISSGSTLSREALLHKILEQVVEYISPIGNSPRAVLGSFLSYSEETNELILECIYAPNIQGHFEVGERQVLDRAKGPIGISGRAVLDREAQLVGDVRLDPDYKEIYDQTRSQIDVPLLEGENCIGVLSLESDKPNAFDDEDKKALRSIAELGVIAIQNSRIYEELRITQGRIGASIALAWMGMAESSWRHSVDTDAQTIIERAQLLRNDLKEEIIQNETIDHHLLIIDRLAENIKLKPITPPLSKEQATDSVPINGIVGARTNQLKHNPLYSDAHIQLRLELPDIATVKIDREWLRRAYDILVDNALAAIAENEIKRIDIGTRYGSGGCEIFIADNGPGIPEYVQENIKLGFMGNLNDSRGHGVGLLIAQAIVQSYDGNLKIEYSDSHGTCMVIWLPLEN